MEILQLLPRYLPHEGGIERVLAQLCPKLRLKNFNSTIVTDNFAKHPAFETIDDTKVYRFPFTQSLMSQDPLSILKLQKSFNLLLEKINPEVIHLHSVAQASIFFLSQLLQRSELKSKLFITQHGLLEEVDKTQIAKQLFDKATSLSAVSIPCASSVLAYTQTTKEIQIIPNGVTDDFIHLANPYREWPTSSEPIQLICVGRIESEKGFDIAIRSMAILKARSINAILQIVGTGSQLAYLKQLCTQLNLNETVFFHGEKPHSLAQKFISQAHLILAPSRQREGFGLVVAEAASYGVPAIVADTGGLNETAMHDQTGLVIKDLTPESIAHAITHLACHTNQYLAFSQRAHQFSKSRFNYSQWVNRYVNLYQSCIQN